MVETTHVGSIPRPEGMNARNLEKSIADVIKMQVDAGLDEVNDGEYRRSIFFGDITTLPGFQQHLQRIEYSAGDLTWSPLIQTRLLYDESKPVLSREVAGIKKVLDKIRLREKRTKKRSKGKTRIKVTIPSLSYMSRFYPKKGTKFHKAVRATYPTVDSYLDDAKRVLLNEARRALDAGAERLQFDSPDLLFLSNSDASKREVERYADSTVQLINELAVSLPFERLEVHSCWGNRMNTQLTTEGSIASFIPSIYALKSKTIGPFEVFDGIRDYDEVRAIGDAMKDYPWPSDHCAALGIVSVKARNVEPVSVLRRRYLAITDIIDSDKLLVSPGCGFSSALATIQSFQSASRKLANMVQAVSTSR